MELEELGGSGGGETLTWLLDAVCAPGKKGGPGGDGANSSDVPCVE
jgi:hypothetical protein